MIGNVHVQTNKIETLLQKQNNVISNVHVQTNKIETLLQKQNNNRQNKIKSNKSRAMQESKFDTEVLLVKRWKCKCVLLPEYRNGKKCFQQGAMCLLDFHWTESSNAVHPSDLQQRDDADSEDLWLFFVQCFSDSLYTVPSAALFFPHFCRLAV